MTGPSEKATLVVIVAHFQRNPIPNMRVGDMFDGIVWNIPISYLSIYLSIYMISVYDIYNIYDMI